MDHKESAFPVILSYDPIIFLSPMPTLIYLRCPRFPIPSSSLGLPRLPLLDLFGFSFFRLCLFLPAQLSPTHISESALLLLSRKDGGMLSSSERTEGFDSSRTSRDSDHIVKLRRIIPKCTNHPLSSKLSACLASILAIKSAFGSSPRSIAA